MALGVAFVISPAPTAAQGDTGAQAGIQTLKQEQDALIGIARTLEPSVVHVEAEIPAPTGTGGAPDMIFPFGPETPHRQHSQPGMASGSGIIIDPDGIIVTNRHVVEGANKVTVTLTDHHIYRGVVYSDPNVDLAVIKIDAKNLPAAHLADSSKLQIGQWSIAIGYPFDVGESVSRGIISALGRSQTIENKFYPDLIQTDASINPGNSGGALVDIDGNVIGINTAIAGEAAQSAGIGFAIPSSTVALVWPQLAYAPHKITKYPPGWIRGKLGVQVRPVTPDLSGMLGVDQGALVAEVQPDSPAAHAGVEAGDVIERVNDVKIRDAAELVDAISNLGPNQQAVLTIMRDKTEITRTVVTGTFSETAAATEAPSKRQLGLTLQSLTADMRPDLKLPDTVKAGAVVTAVEPGSPADDALFQQNDVIVQVNDTPVRSSDDFTEAVKAAKAGDTLGVKAYRGATTVFLTLQVPEDTTGK